MVESQAPPYHTETDVAVLVSTDGGQTFGNMHYVNTPDTGQDTDQPRIATNPVWPYDTWVTWTGHNQHWINWIKYDASLSFAHGVPVSIESAYPASMPNPVVKFPRVAVGPVPNCQVGAPHEGVYVTWAAVSSDTRCDWHAYVPGMQWWYSVFDVDANAWAPGGPWQIDAADPTWPECIGGGSPRDDFSTNQPSADIALDPSTGWFWAAHSQSTPHTGTRATLFKNRMVCQGGTLTPAVGGGATVSFQPPDPCYDTAQPCVPGGMNGPAGPDGAPAGYVVNDNWGASVAFQQKPVGAGTVPVLLMTWLDTRGDPGNMQAGLWGVTTDDYGATYSPIFLVSGASWDYTANRWWDYNGIGVDATQGAFFPAWGGDARFGTTMSEIRGALLQ